MIQTPRQSFPWSLWRKRSPRDPTQIVVSLELPDVFLYSFPQRLILCLSRAQLDAGLARTEERAPLPKSMGNRFSPQSLFHL